MRNLAGKRARRGTNFDLLPCCDPVYWISASISKRMDVTSQDDFEIPVLDISDLSEEAAKAMVDAAERYGFIFIRNNQNAIPSAQIDGAFELVRHHDLCIYHIMCQMRLI